MDTKDVENLRRALREMGYSSKAIEEILKWYKQSNSQVGKYDKGRLRSDNRS